MVDTSELLPWEGPIRFPDELISKAEFPDVFIGKKEKALMSLDSFSVDELLDEIRRRFKKLSQ